MMDNPDSPKKQIQGSKPKPLADWTCWQALGGIHQQEPCLNLLHLQEVRLNPED
jgi:hypothetical protein